MRIPEVREELRQLAVHLSCPRLDELADELIRRRRAPRRRAKAKKITEEMKEQVRAFARANPKMLHREIGEYFGVDGGRVSEILHGYRK